MLRRDEFPHSGFPCRGDIKGRQCANVELKTLHDAAVGGLRVKIRAVKAHTGIWKGKHPTATWE